MNADTERNLRRVAYQRLICRPQRLTLPAEPVAADDNERPTAAGCLLGIAIILGTAAIAWIAVIGLAWMIAGWLI